MCGICGIYNFKSRGSIDPFLLEKMCDVMQHRGPDDWGYVLFESSKAGKFRSYKNPGEPGIGNCSACNLALGHRRLSIIDLSPAAHQPMSNEDKTVWLVHNGEIYNFRNLREDLIKHGHIFQSKSDSESILHLYEEAGISCLQHLRGMFSFAIWDAKKKQIFIARDRLGIKPLYYSLLNETFIFASEIKSILQHSDFKKEIDYSALDLYFKYQYIPGERTIFKGIKKLLPGHYIILKGGKIDIKRYWQLRFKADYKKTEEQWKEETLAMLRDSIQMRLVSDVPLGVFLSGGLDSSALVALLSESGNIKKLKTFTVGFKKQTSMLEDYDERSYARMIARKFNTEHHEFVVQESVLNILPEIIWHFDEPFSNLTAIATYFISQLARKHITVALAGVGGDENFGGYPRYLAARYLRYYLLLPPVVRNNIFRKIGELFPENPSEYTWNNRLRKFLIGADNAFLKSYDNWTLIFNNRQRRDIFTDDAKGKIGKAVDRECIEDGSEDALNQIYLNDFQSYIPDNLLAYSDRMSMAASLEVRVPFCDYKFVEFAATIPPEKKIQRGKLKYLLKRYFSNILPVEIINRKKQGFSIPPFYSQHADLGGLFRYFFSKENLKQQGIFNYESIDCILRAHSSGKVNHFTRLITLLVFQVWFEIYFKNSLSKPNYSLSEMGD